MKIALIITNPLICNFISIQVGLILRNYPYSKAFITLDQSSILSQFFWLPFSDIYRLFCTIAHDSRGANHPYDIGTWISERLSRYLVAPDNLTRIRDSSLICDKSMGDLLRYDFSLPISVCQCRDGLICTSWVMRECCKRACNIRKGSQKNWDKIELWSKVIKCSYYKG